MIIQIKNINEDKSNNQTSLFENTSDENDDFDYLPSTRWSKKQLLSEEFKSIGFYISDHPLSDYKDVFNQLNISSHKDFFSNDESEALVAGTIMSIQEKKKCKRNTFCYCKVQ